MIKSAVIHFDPTGFIFFGVCESLKLIVDKAMSATIQKPRAEVADLIFAAPNRNTTYSTSTSQNLFLLRPIITKYGSAPR